MAQTISVKAKVQTKDAKKREVKFHPLITDALLGKPQVKKGITQIGATMKEQARLGVTLGRNLYSLHENFNAHFKALKKARPSEKTQAEAFYDFIEKRFGLKERRVQELIRVAKNSRLANLDIHSSSLVEIARLPDKQLGNLLKTVKADALKKMSFRQVQKVVRTYQPQSKKTHAKKAVAQIEKPQAPAEFNVIDVSQLKDIEPEALASIAVAEFRRAFVQVKEILVDMNGTPILGLDGLLEEISQWTEDRKTTNVKKGA